MYEILKSKRKGVIFIEIFVVVVILYLYIFIKFETPRGEYRVLGGRRESAAAVQIIGIESAIDLYRKHNGFYPTTEQGLKALVTKPTTDPQPENYLEGGYMKGIPKDPWWNDFIYRNQGEEGPIDIISCGSDGEVDTEDDITNHNMNIILETVKSPF